MNKINIVSSTVLRNNLADSLSLVENKKDYILVSNRGKVKLAIVNIDMLEDLLALTNPGYLADIKEARENIKNGELYTFEEVFGKI